MYFLGKKYKLFNLIPDKVLFLAEFLDKNLLAPSPPDTKFNPHYLHKAKYWSRSIY